MKNKKLISMFSVCLAALSLASCKSNAPSVTTTENITSSETTTSETTTSETTTSETTTSETTTVETTTVDTTTVVTTTDETPAVIYKKYAANVSTGTTSGDYNLADDIQDGAILHAWNWSYNTIKNNLKSIAECGYSAVQTSPVQQSKSMAKSGTWTSEWSKLYQPVAFHVAEDSYLGTKEELAELCTEAKKYGIRVICDIVVNHMGNDETGKGYSSRIAEYEPEIAANTSTYFHNYSYNVTDDNAKTVTQYMLSNLPDLNTGNATIQTKVTDLLKECIDCGVSGFRFDAAKHIETPDDGAYASSFWPTVLNGATEYAESLGLSDPYYYGEILNTPGGGRSYDSYTEYMSITDSKYSTKFLNGVSKYANAYFGDNFTYSFSDDGTKAVVWAESHDNYADGSTSGITQENINRVYAVEMSHSGAAGLYFARPAEDTAMGDMGTKAWKSDEISAVNNFHNTYLGYDETMSLQSGYYLNERGTEAAMIVSMEAMKYTKKITLQCDSLADGTYYDQVTGNEFTVADGVLTGKMSKVGIVVLETKQACIAPTISVTPETGYYYGTISDTKTGSVDVSIALKNQDSAAYTINGENETALTGASTSISIVSDADTAVLRVTASNSMKSADESFTFKKVTYREGYWAMAGLKNADSVTYYAWVWLYNHDGKWMEVEVVDDVAYIPYSDLSEYNCYLLVSFEAGTTLDQLNAWAATSDGAWSHKLGQTSDVLRITEDYISIETSTI